MNKIEWREVEGYTVPEAVDDTSSSVYTYVRRNIREIRNRSYTGKDAKGNHWIYEEAKITKEDFKDYVASESLRTLLELSSKVSELESELKHMRMLLNKKERKEK